MEETKQYVWKGEQCKFQEVSRENDDKILELQTAKRLLR